MSEDQRPVRVRVVNNNLAPAGSPQRRRNDPAVRAVPASIPGVQARGQGIGLFGAVLFLLGCAAGGALSAFLGLFRMLGL